MDLPVWAAIIIMATSLPLFGQEIHLRDDTSAATTQPAAVDEPYSYPKILLAMSAVVGLIFALKWGAGKLNPGLTTRSAGTMSVLSRLPMGPKQQLILVKVGRRAVLVGQAGGQMSSLCEITDADELAHLVGQAQGEKTVSAGFASLFKKQQNDFEPNRREISQITETREDEELALEARRELLGLTERVRGLSKEINGV
jgi:flagellar biogenesis protein FliO